MKIEEEEEEEEENSKPSRFHTIPTNQSQNSTQS